MIGDSITDCGRSRWGSGVADGGLGDGYVSLVNGLLVATYPQSQIRIINMGISGNTVRDLKGRWKSDVLEHAPDWLSILIGINDVWQHFESWWGSIRLVSVDDYAEILEDLIRQTRPHLDGLILMTPYYLETDRTDPMRVMMDQFADVVRQLAEQYQAILVDTVAAFDEVLEHVDPLELAQDRVHLNLPGHMILARAFLDAVGYSW